MPLLVYGGRRDHDAGHGGGLRHGGVRHGELFVAGDDLLVEHGEALLEPGAIGARVCPCSEAPVRWTSACLQRRNLIVQLVLLRNKRVKRRLWIRNLPGLDDRLRMLRGGRGWSCLRFVPESSMPRDCVVYTWPTVRPGGRFSTSLTKLHHPGALQNPVVHRWATATIFRPPSLRPHMLPGTIA